MIRISQLKGQRVLAKDNAQLVGSVRRLLLDPSIGRIVAVELDGVPDNHSIVEWPQVSAIGRDALMVASAVERRGPLDETEQAFVAGHLDLEGKLVLDDAGDSHGRLTDLAFDEKTGAVTEIEVPGHTLPVERILALGSYALIVPVPAPG